MALDPLLLEILACPEDRGPLYYFEDEDALYNPRLKRRYAIRDGIPVMLIDEAETVEDAEHASQHDSENDLVHGCFPPPMYSTFERIPLTCQRRKARKTIPRMMR